MQYFVCGACGHGDGDGKVRPPIESQRSTRTPAAQYRFLCKRNLFPFLLRNVKSEAKLAIPRPHTSRQVTSGNLIYSDQRRRMDRRGSRWPAVGTTRQAGGRGNARTYHVGGRARTPAEREEGWSERASTSYRRTTARASQPTPPLFSPLVCFLWQLRRCWCCCWCLVVLARG